MTPIHDSPIRVPAGAWDTHCHVFGPSDVYPFAERRGFTPPDAPWERLLDVERRIGVEHVVLVQASVHGTDHRALLDALAELRRDGGEHAAVAIIDDTVDDRRLRELDSNGVRGARFNLVPHLSARVDPREFRRQLSRVASLDWHAVVHVAPDQIEGLGELVPAGAPPVVIDHMGRIKAAAGVEQPAFRALLSVLETRPDWRVKITGADRMTEQPRGNWSDCLPFVRRLVEAFPDRVLWGTDWPHANTDPVTEDDDVVAFLHEAVPDEHLLHQIVVQNPRSLYAS